jgi:hypothetical protein
MREDREKSIIKWFAGMFCVQTRIRLKEYESIIVFKALWHDSLCVSKTNAFSLCTILEVLNCTKHTVKFCDMRDNADSCSWILRI